MTKALSSAYGTTTPGLVADEYAKAVDGGMYLTAIKQARSAVTSLNMLPDAERGQFPELVSAQVLEPLEELSVLGARPANLQQVNWDLRDVMRDAHDLREAIAPAPSA